jgi:peptidoglycan/xylan/chitin deacetylase (PgdA/CDA1 family)
VRRIFPLGALHLAAALAVLALSEPARAPAWGLLAATFSAVMVWGTVDLRSGVFVRARTRGPRPAQPRVALTFDDGPDPQATPALLDLLAERGVKAAFFLVGERARAQPELVRRIAAEGHLVGNHSDRHGAFTNLYPRARLCRELAACQASLATLSGETPRYYRPPFGLANHAIHGAARLVGLEVVGWEVRGLDTGGRSAEAVVRRVLAGLTPGGIALLHDGGQAPERVRAVVAGVLDGLAARGLEPVRLDALLDGDAG